MNRAMSISFCMNIFVALIIARSVRPPVHLISLHILYVCLHVYMLRHIYIYIYIFFLLHRSPLPRSISAGFLLESNLRVSTNSLYFSD